MREAVRGRRPLTLPHILLFLFALLLAGGCGKKLAPVSPDAVLPGVVREFKLAQEGESLVLSWLLPRENLLGQPLTQVKGCRLYRGEIRGVEPIPGCPPDLILLADIDLAYPRAGEVRGEAIVYRDLNLVPGWRYSYQVAAYLEEDYPGPWSKTLSHAWGLLPRAPKELKAQAGDRLVGLAWSPVTQLANGSPLRDLEGYYLYRRARGEDWRRLTPEAVKDSAFQDVAAANDVEYTYKVRAVRRLGPDRLESLDSPTVAAVPEDLTPPPPLLNLVMVPTTEGVALRWEISPAPDLAGYRVYRRRSGEARFTRLTAELIKKPYFLDAQVSKGQTYYYYVTAVDNSRRANESLPSEETAVVY
ncbi:MAG: hypothetical protein A2Y80_00590 [Deltaproteobacteria bacterium RBG_13_58_19]|nr:MAG: hypothetical protein A2Y80_00590 [Deltaproteobacteria bacterium RBG_13_58_19]